MQIKILRNKYIFFFHEHPYIFSVRAEKGFQLNKITKKRSGILPSVQNKVIQNVFIQKIHKEISVRNCVRITPPRPFTIISSCI